MSFNKKEFVTPASDLELAVTKEVSASNKESSNCSKMAFILLGAMLVAVCISQLCDGQNNVHDGVRPHVPTSRRLDVEPTSNSPKANAEASEKAAAQALAEALKNSEAATQEEANARQERDDEQHKSEGLQEAKEKADSAKVEKEAALEKAKGETESAVESIFFRYEQVEGGTCAEGQSIEFTGECEFAVAFLGIHSSPNTGCTIQSGSKAVCKIAEKVPLSAKERADEKCAQPVVSLEPAPREVVVSLPGESGCLKSAGVGQQLIQNAQSGCARFEIHLIGEKLSIKQFRSLDHWGSCLDVSDGKNFKLSECIAEGESQAFTNKGDQWEVRHSSGKRVQALAGWRCSNLRDAEAAEKTAAKALEEAEKEAKDASRPAEEAEKKRQEADQKLLAKTEASGKAALAKDVAEAALAKAVAEAARCVGPAECLGRSKNVCEREGKCTWTGVSHGCAGSAECFGKKKGVCKRMMKKEGKCQWIPKPSAEVLPKCSSLAGDKTNLQQTAKFCWHLKGRADLCHTSYVSSSTNGFNKFIRMCRFEATTGKCKGDKLYCEP